MDSKKKKEIIFSDKGKFTTFLSNASKDTLTCVFDDEGISYLKKYSDIENRIAYILVWSEYAGILFNNINFLDLFLSTNISYYYASLSQLDEKTCDLIIERCLKLEKSDKFISELLSYFNRDYQLKFIDKYDYPNDLIYEILKQSPNYTGPKILKKYNIDLLTHNISIDNLIRVGKELNLKQMSERNKEMAQINKTETFYLSSDLLTPGVAQHLWNKLNVYEYRFLINDVNYCGDPTFLNKYAKEREDEYILNSNYLEPYNSIIKMILNIGYLDVNSEEYFVVYENLNKQLHIFGNDYLKIYKLLFQKKFSEAYNLVETLLEEKRSDYIIDYHFEENYYNIMYDLRELLDFYYSGNIELSSEKLSLYEQIANIDKLSMQEKIKLHNTLKNYNMIEMFYDDMAYARKIVREAIKNYAMVKDDLANFKDEKMSLEYGVDVYNIEDNSFFAIVKSSRYLHDTLPTGHSFSLIGNGCISVFGDLEDSDTFVYDASNLNPEQIVHVYPTDSFTMYKPFEFSEQATKRVEQLMMPDEMLYESKTYNEILILEKGRKQTDLDPKIPELKQIALYCVDRITNQDVEVAKLNGVGIMFIDSKKYNKGVQMPPNIYRHMEKKDFYNYNYVLDGYQEEVEKCRNTR